MDKSEVKELDKNEYSMKLEEMRLLAEDRNYQGAAMIADDINWNKVRNINTLCMVGRIYEHLNRTEDARELYLMAYNRAPSSKNALYRLTRISIRNGNTQEAEMYFRNFSQNAPRDRARYVLAYQISCMKDEPLEMRIAILEDLKKREFTEEWTYELAYLYYQAGQAENCVETCDELALWFGDGEYVKKALELKRCFRPLSTSQEAKYKRLLESENIKTSNSALEAESLRIQQEERADDPDAAEAAALAEVQAALAEAVSEVEAERHGNEGAQVQTAGESSPAAEATKRDSSDGVIPDSMIAPVQRPGQARRPAPVREPSHEELSIVSFSADRLHAELVEASAGIEAAKDQETVESILRSIRKMTVDLPFLQEAGSRAAAAFRNDVMSDAVDENLLRNFRELKEEETGKFEDSIPENVSDIEKPKIEDVLTEWEKTKKAAEEAILSARKERLAMAKGAALKEAEAMIARLEEIMPIVQADVVPEVSHAWDAMEKKEEEETFTRDAMRMRRPVPPAAETQEEPAPEAKESHPESEQEAAAPGQEEDGAVLPVVETSEPVKPAEAEEEKPEFLKAGEDQALAAILAAGQLELAAGAAEAAAEQQMEGNPTVEAGERPDSVEDTPLAEPAEEAAAGLENPEPEPSGQPDAAQADEEENLILFNKEQKDYFAYFLCVEGMELMLRRAVTGVLNNADGSSSASGNVIVEGGDGSGKTVLATSLIKVLQELKKKRGARIGKISAASLNSRDLASLIPKLNGGFLIVEKAGELTADTVSRMAETMKGTTGGLLVLLEDTPEGIEKVLSLNPAFSAMFTQRVTIPVFGINELVEFGKFYAREMECDLDEMAVLAMYNRINNIRTVEHPTYLTEVKEIVDRAIISAEKGSGKKGFGKMFAKRYNENDYLILREEDFNQ